MRPCTRSPVICACLTETKRRLRTASSTILAIASAFTVSRRLLALLIARFAFARPRRRYSLLPGIAKQIQLPGRCHTHHFK